MSNPTPSTTSAAAAPVGRAAGPSAKQIGVVVAILAITLVVTSLTSNVTQVLEPGIRLVNNAPYLPERFAGWQGGELQGLSDEERKALPADTEGARRVYRNAAGAEVYCSVVLAGRDVTSIHRPELCLPGQGWRMESQGSEFVETRSVKGGRLEVMRIDSKRELLDPKQRGNLMRSLFVYWFIGKDRVTAHHWQRILWTAKDRVFHNRNHRWAYVLVFTPVGLETQGAGLPPQAREHTLALIKQFVQDVSPELMATSH